jgi:chloramphenicol-sensitive protein RarD
VAEVGPSETRAGYIYGIIAYLSWGLIPLYFATVKHVVPYEILSHRIVWSLLILLICVASIRKLGELRRVLLTKKLLLLLTVSSIFLAINWLLYIYATVTNRVSEASLGYYMMPLVNAFLGFLFLGERLRPLHYPALFLVLCAVLVPAIAKGSFSWISITLPVSFGLYGLIRKKAPVESLVGLTVETVLLFVPSLSFLMWQKYHGEGAFLTTPHDTAWLMFGGVATVVPLLAFTLSIRRLPLLAVSFIQFLSPTMQILVAVTLLHEKVDWVSWVAIAIVLLAVVLFITDAVLQANEKRRTAAVIPQPDGVVVE